MKPEDLIELFGKIVLFASAVFAVIQYVQQKKREFQKRFFDEQLKTYSEAVEHAAAIVVFDKKDIEFQNAETNFKKLYWGRMCIVEDKNVEARMALFFEALDVYMKTDDKSLELEAKNTLKNYSLALAHACRNSCIHTWGVDLDSERNNNYAGSIKDRPENKN